MTLPIRPWPWLVEKALLGQRLTSAGYGGCDDAALTTQLMGDTSYKRKTQLVAIRFLTTTAATIVIIVSVAQFITVIMDSAHGRSNPVPISFEFPKFLYDKPRVSLSSQSPLMPLHESIVLEWRARSEEL